MSTRKTLLLFLGGSLSLLGVILLMTGWWFLINDLTSKDDDGYFSDTIYINRSSHAITSKLNDMSVIDLDGNLPGHQNNFASIKIEATSIDFSKTVFIGIAENSDIENYLNDVEYDEISGFGVIQNEVDYTNNPGSSVPAKPATRTFWMTSAYGNITETLSWEPEGDNPVLVIMSADGSAGIDLDIYIGMEVPWLFWLGLELVIGGAVVLIAGVVILYFILLRKKDNSETGP